MSQDNNLHSRSLPLDFDEKNDQFSTPAVNRGMGTIDPYELPAHHGLAQPVATRGLDLSYEPNRGLDVQSSPFKDVSIPHKDNVSSYGDFHQYNSKQTQIQAQVQVQPQAQAPIAVGGYLEPHYHFYSQTSDNLMKKVRDVLNAAKREFHIDIEEITEKFRFNCEYYSAGGSSYIPFVVRIFRVNHRPELAVEFQRRKGDQVQFFKIYQTCMSHFNQMGVVFDPDAQNRRESRFAPKHEEISPEQSQETIQCLLQMLSSEYVDVQSEAIQALTELAAGAAMRHALIQSGAVSLLVKASQSNCEDVHRCAVTSLAHLTSIADACAVVSKEGGLDAAIKLASTTRTPQVQRECTRLLSNVAQTLGKNAFSTCTSEISSLRRLSDATAIAHVNSLMSAIGTK